MSTNKRWGSPEVGLEKTVEPLEKMRQRSELQVRKNKGIEKRRRRTPKGNPRGLESPIYKGPKDPKRHVAWKHTPRQRAAWLQPRWKRSTSIPPSDTCPKTIEEILRGILNRHLCPNSGVRVKGDIVRALLHVSIHVSNHMLHILNYAWIEAIGLGPSYLDHTCTPPEWATSST